MRQHRIPHPQQVRRIGSSFAWIDHRLIRDGHLERMTHHDQVLYLFLVLVADRYGVSFYRKEKICDCLGLDWGEFEIARDRLIDLGLIAFERYSAFTPNGFYQVLPIDGRASLSKQRSSSVRSGTDSKLNDMASSCLRASSNGMSENGLPAERPKSGLGASPQRLNGLTRRADHEAF